MRPIHFLVLSLAVSSIHGVVVAENPPCLFSSRLAMTIAAGLPEFDPKQASGGKSGQTEVLPSKATSDLAQPYDVVELPKFVVKADKIPAVIILPSETSTMRLLKTGTIFEHIGKKLTASSDITGASGAGGFGKVRLVILRLSW